MEANIGRIQPGWAKDKPAGLQADPELNLNKVLHECESLGKKVMLCKRDLT